MAACPDTGHTHHRPLLQCECWSQPGRKKAGQKKMNYNFIKMFRQRVAGYHRLLEFHRRTCFFFFLFSVSLVLLFIARPLSVGPWNEIAAGSRTLPVIRKERRVPAVKDLSVAPPTAIKPNGAVPNLTKPKVIANCSSGNVCRSSRQPRAKILDPAAEPGSSCPDYFRWIHEDLKPWRKSGITLEMVEKAKRTASFRLIIVSGRMYIETYVKSFQTRDLFTIWGLVQLMEYYPGMLPDLDLMFDCVDWPVVKSEKYSDRNPPPPLFRYCGDNTTLDIDFPDWSFWGWAEVNIRPWDGLLNEIYKGTQKIKWEERHPTAYWKGNPFVDPGREDLMKCNLSGTQDWNARLYIQDWIRESEQGYKQSRLSEQCDHRYKIYIEGSAWSVSLKYILACDSTTLLVKPKYYDFFSRGLIPQLHYLPVRPDKKCASIKLAVDWGNKHMGKAKAIGKTASTFIRTEVKMSNVYDYMFHLLTEYAKLLKYKPSVTEGAREHCSDSMLLCSKRSKAERLFMKESMVRSASDKRPCNLVGDASAHV